MNKGRTVAQALREAAARLAAISDTARLDAELLMAHVLGCSRSEMLVRRMDDPKPSDFAQLVERRAGHEPVAYILGQQEFYGLPFTVTPDVLIPRGDSETLVEKALAEKPDARTVLDCGTGTGALLLAVLDALGEARGIGIDSSPGAIAVAEENARSLGLAARAEMHLADWTKPGWSDGLGGPFDLILANPPYVETQADLDSSVREFEPAQALFAGGDGLAAYRVLVPQIPGLLAPGGAAFFEIGATQAEAVSAIARDAGLLTNAWRDLANRPRVLQFAQVQ